MRRWERGLLQVRLELTTPYPAWRTSAWRGRLTDEDGTRDVLVLRGPEGASDEGFARARQQLALMELAKVPGVLLPDLVVRKDDRLCWVHEPGALLALEQVLGEDKRQLPLAAAVEVVARVSATLSELGALGLGHPGPIPSDVLVTAEGSVLLAGLVPSGARRGGMQDPSGDEDGPALVFRLGALMCWLATGVEPERSSDRTVHEAGVRRALIRVMSRPGPVVTERFSNWFRSMWAWESGERPAVGELADALRRIADDLGAPALRPWALVHVQSFRPIETDELDDPTSFMTPSMHTDDQTDPSVDPSVGFVLPPQDDPTQEAAASALDTQDATPAVVGVNVPLGPPSGAFGMPVRVGPPAAAIRERPALPSGFLDTEGEPEDTDGVAGLPPPSLLPGWLVTVLLLGTSMGLILVGALLVAYLLEPAEVPVEAPRIGEVLSVPKEETRVIVVRNPSGASLLVRCGEAETRTSGDAIMASIVPRCTVTAELGGDVVSIPVDVAGIVEVFCFDGEPVCEAR